MCVARRREVRAHRAPPRPHHASRGDLLDQRSPVDTLREPPPAEVDHLIGGYSKARRDLGWEPRTGFEDLIRLMTRADLELLSP